MKLSLAILLISAALVVRGSDFPDEPIEHEYHNHIIWFEDVSDDCLKKCHTDGLKFKSPALHVGYMLGCMDGHPALCEKSNGNCFVLNYF